MGDVSVAEMLASEAREGVINGVGRVVVLTCCRGGARVYINKEYG